MNKPQTGSLIGKRTNREDAKEVDMAEESAQFTEKRLKVIEDSTNALVDPL